MPCLSSLLRSGAREKGIDAPEYGDPVSDKARDVESLLRELRRSEERYRQLFDSLRPMFVHGGE